jgi:outer membrane protein assembly factor BamB
MMRTRHLSGVIRMQIRSIVLSWLFLVVTSSVAQPVPALSDEPVLGNWKGSETYKGETRAIALHFERYAAKNGALVVYYDNPSMKFHRVGPMPTERNGAVYSNAYFTLTLSDDRRTLAGAKHFDGHELGITLERGDLPPAPEKLADTTPIARPVWTFATSAPIWSSPAYADNTVIVGSNDGNIYALDANSGRLRWKFATQGAVMGAPTIEGVHAYVLSDDGGLYKLRRADGTLVWRFDTHGGGTPRDLPSNTSATYDYLASAPTIADGVIYIGSADKRLYAVDAKSGAERWHFDTKGIVRSTAAVQGGRVYFGSYDHHVYALQAKDGSLLWKRDTLQPVVSSPAVWHNTVYIGSRSSDLFALDATNGEPRWAFFYWSSWVESSPRVVQGTLYVGSSDYANVFAIDASNGREIWRFDCGGSPWGMPAVSATRVFSGAVGSTDYFIDHRGGFFSLDRATGKPVWKFPMAAIAGSFTNGVASSPLLARGNVYFGGLDGVLYAFTAN